MKNVAEVITEYNLQFKDNSKNEPEWENWQLSLLTLSDAMDTWTVNMPRKRQHSWRIQIFETKRTMLSEVQLAGYDETQESVK